MEAIEHSRALFGPNQHPLPEDLAEAARQAVESAKNENETAMQTSLRAALAKAEEYATQQVALIPTLRCRIYDHQGLAVQPIREIRGTHYKAESEISARFRRWAGSILFFGGLALIVFDWSTDFNLSWPATIGVRMFPVGLILLVTELVIIITTKRAHRDTA